MTDDGQQVSASKRKQLDELQAEALKNLVAVFTEDEKNSAEDMYSFLVKAGGDKFAGKIVNALAAAFYEQAHYERGIEAYELMLKLDPTGPDAPEYGLAIAQGYSTIEDWAKLKATYERLLKTFTLPEPGNAKAGAWARAQTNPEVVKAAQAKIEKQLREDAVSLHAKAQRDKTSRAEFEGAAALYEVYLSKFGKSDASYEVEFNLGEIYFYHLGKNSEAATHYLATARRNPKGPLTHDALYNALAALERLALRRVRKARPRARPTSTRSSPRRWSSTSSSIPNDPDVPELLFRQGKLYYDYQVYDPAVRQWGLLLEKYPQLEVRRGRRRAHPRLVQQDQGLLEHRDLGAPAEDGAGVSGGRTAEAARHAHRAVGVQAGRAEGRGGRPRRGGGGVPARGQGVSQRRARRRRPASTPRSRRRRRATSRR